MRITNSTGEDLQLVTYSESGTSVHWQQRPSDLGTGQVQTINVYAAGDPQIKATYRGTRTGVVYQLKGSVPSFGSNVAEGSTSDSAYAVKVNSASGYNPTSTYELRWEPSFTYTCHAETVTVPEGITRLHDANGGKGGDTFVKDPFGDVLGVGYRPELPLGSHLVGDLEVTPGQTFTIAVGGSGGNGGPSFEGGWSIDDYHRGDGGLFQNENSGGGGGATVLKDGSGNLLLVAGGGGGSYGEEADATPVLLDRFPNGGYGGTPGGPSNSGGASGDDRLQQGITGSAGEDATADSGGAGGGGGGGYVGGARGQAHKKGGESGGSYGPSFTLYPVFERDSAEGRNGPTGSLSLNSGTDNPTPAPPGHW